MNRMNRGLKPGVLAQCCAEDNSGCVKLVDGKYRASFSYPIGTQPLPPDEVTMLWDEDEYYEWETSALVYHKDFVLQSDAVRFLKEACGYSG